MLKSIRHWQSSLLPSASARISAKAGLGVAGRFSQQFVGEQAIAKLS
jgi:hypothetical protein